MLKIQVICFRGVFIQFNIPNMSNVTHGSYMFAGCKELIEAKITITSASIYEAQHMLR